MIKPLVPQYLLTLQNKTWAFSALKPISASFSKHYCAISIYPFFIELHCIAPVMKNFVMLPSLNLLKHTFHWKHAKFTTWNSKKMWMVLKCVTPTSHLSFPRSIIKNLFLILKSEHVWRQKCYFLIKIL